MSDIAVASPSPRRGKRREDCPSIELPDGETLDPRIKFALRIGLSERTLVRMNLPQRIIGGVAYVQRNAALKQIGAGVKRRNEPPARRRRVK